LAEIDFNEVLYDKIILGGSYEQEKNKAVIFFNIPTYYISVF